MTSITDISAPRPVAAAIEPKLYRQICRLVYEHAGIRLKEGKEALVQARLARRLRELGLDDARRYLRYLENDLSGRELVHLVDVMSTNYTSFMREPEHFDWLERSLRRALRQGRTRLRLWSAAASTGEEPYSMAMVVDQVLEGRPVDARILATDISSRALARAERGLYDERTLAPVSRAQRKRYFLRQHDGGATCYAIRPRLRDMVLFRRLNLSAPPFPLRGPFDVIFLRNVMIYFDLRVRTQLLGEIVPLLRPGGCLIIGHAETLTGIATGLEMLRPSIYRKPGGRADV